MNTPSPQNPSLLNWLLIGSLGIIWGAAFMSVSVSLQGFGPMTVAAIRVGVGGLALFIIGTILGQGVGTISKTAGRRGWLFASVIGAGALALPFLLLSWGQQFIPSAFAGVAMGAVPLIVLPLAYVFSPEEGIGPRRVIGMILGFIGLVILIGPQAITSGPETDMAFWGRLACLGAAACYACGSITTRRAPKMLPIAFATASVLVAAAILVPLALIFEGWPTEWPLGPTQAVIYAALFPTALSAVIRVRVVTTAGSVFMSLTSYQVPIWSVIFGVLLMGESLPPQLFTALALILAGIAIAQSRSLLAVIRPKT